MANTHRVTQNYIEAAILQKIPVAVSQNYIEVSILQKIPVAVSQNYIEVVVLGDIDISNAPGLYIGQPRRV